MTWKILASLTTASALLIGSAGCKKELPYCAAEGEPTVELHEKWRAFALPLPKGAKTCASSLGRVDMAGVGRDLNLHETLPNFLTQQGFVLDDERTATSSGTTLTVGMRKGLYGLELRTVETRDGYLVTLSEFEPYEGWMETVQNTGGIPPLDIQIRFVIKESATKGKDFWRELRMIFATQWAAGNRLPLKRDYARKDAGQLVYERVLQDPKSLLAAIDDARVRNLTQIRVVEIDKATDPRLSPLQAIAAEAVGLPVKLVELLPTDAKPKAEAALVLGLFKFSDEHRRAVYLPPEVFKDGPVQPSDLAPRGPKNPAAK